MSSSGGADPTPPPAPVRGNPFPAFAVLLVFTALAILAHRGKAGHLDALQSAGRTVTGRVTDVTSQRSNLRNPTSRSHFVHYEYTVDGRRLTSSDQVSQARASGYRRGDPIAVTYLPSDPKRTSTSLAEARARSSGFGTQGVLTIGLAWLLTAGVIGWRYVRGQSA